ncbi:hypothetical protein K505DRAFT_130265 [Melanomma pulvis-pyrius CBS 109.77]|uniref:Uncharacterized protein n=1 Tax=Melanomma pulvis-pyrius CBS 109.77 TaxID=1314802 RepID=A0A6A6WU43_9PLEO|nr:hypothetical protein K505DRAFT_130265 [Melanomma pulvis-pyrius CBS 109.77]
MQENNTLMIPGSTRSYSRSSTPSNSSIDSGMERQASLPSECIGGSQVMAQFDIHHSPNTTHLIVGGTSLTDSVQPAQSNTWPLNKGQRLSAPRITRYRSVSQPQQANFLKIRTQEQLKRRSMTNIGTRALDHQSHYNTHSEPLSINIQTTSGDAYSYNLPYR